MTETTKLDAWSARALAEALNMNVTTAERALDAAVVDGEITRVSCGVSSFYVPVQLAATLEQIDAAPVEGDRLAERRARARRIAARLRLDRLDPKGGKR